LARSDQPALWGAQPLGEEQFRVCIKRKSRERKSRDLTASQLSIWQIQSSGNRFYALNFPVQQN
jgi:hypothetical protein